MATRVDLRTYDNGYWGYMSEDVKHTLASLSATFTLDEGAPADAIRVTANGDVAVIGALGCVNLEVKNMTEATDDADAAGKGVFIDELYHTAGAVKIRRT